MTTRGEDPALDITLATYGQTAELYRETYPPHTPVWLAAVDRFVAGAAGGHVLEVGSGPGRDAALLEERGLSVTRSDATPAFVAMMAADGHPALLLDVRRDPLGGPYDGVFANAVLLHLGRHELARAAARLGSAVRPGGLLFATVKEGDGEAWSTHKLNLPRHFTYWREPALRGALTEAGWTLLSLDHIADRRPGREPWIYVLAQT